MSRYNYAKRLKRMLDNECEITRMETRIARKSAKYYETISESVHHPDRQMKQLNNKFIRSRIEDCTG